MDFMNRGSRGNPQASSQANTSPSAGAGNNTQSANSNKKKKSGAFSEISQVGKITFLFLLALLVALAIFSLIMFKGGSRESRQVDATKYQAVFLNGGQVYFGKIDTLNDKFTSLNSIFYLRVNQQVQPDANSSANDISLVKLGCELHGPTDQMIINRDQVIFWENLKDDGQVAKAIAEYKNTYPNGEDCNASQDQGASNATESSNVNATESTDPKQNTTTNTTENN